jgi:hypothetical protein
MEQHLIFVYHYTVATSTNTDCTLFPFLYGSLALWTWPLFQFLNPIHSRYDSLYGDQPVARPRYLHTEQHKHRINALRHIHASSGIPTHDPSV